jgi:membrane-associated phospholipid phosphatase
LLVTGLLVIAAVETAIMVMLFQVFTLTRGGQLVETIALASNTLGSARIGRPINSVLDAISIVAVAIVMAVVGFIALIRRRFALAVTSVVLIGGANASAELLKHYLVRPNLGIDEARAAAGNSFPSGHTAIAASAVVAFVLVLPPRLRGFGAVFGSLYAAVVGVATLSAGWHRPSDAVASFLLVGVWAALAGVLLRFLRRRDETVVEAESHKASGVTLWLTGLIMLGFAAIGLWETHMFADPDGLLSRHDREIAYAGSAAGILAASCLMMAVILLTVHRVVPRRPYESG